MQLPIFKKSKPNFIISKPEKPMKKVLPKWQFSNSKTEKVLNDSMYSELGKIMYNDIPQNIKNEYEEWLKRQVNKRLEKSAMDNAPDNASKEELEKELNNLLTNTSIEALIEREKFKPRNILPLVENYLHFLQNQYLQTLLKTDPLKFSQKSQQSSLLGDKDFMDYLSVKYPQYYSVFENLQNKAKEFENLKTVSNTPSPILSPSPSPSSVEDGEKIDLKMGGKKKTKSKKSKKSKKTNIRKHKGINQTTGRLKKGYKYSGKKLKSGLPEIIKILK